jgi:hypothetical protein
LIYISSNNVDIRLLTPSLLFTCRFFTSSHIQLHPTTLHCTSLHLSTLHFFTFTTSSNSNSLHITTLVDTSLLHIYNFTQLHSTPLHLSTLHFLTFTTSPNYASLHITTLVDASLFLRIGRLMWALCPPAFVYFRRCTALIYYCLQPALTTIWCLHTRFDAARTMMQGSVETRV